MPTTFLRLSACLSLALLCACSSDSLGKYARGNWQGTADEQRDTGENPSYPITVIINDDEHVVVDYPTYHCSSKLVRLPSSDGHAEFREEITNGTQNCISGGLVTLLVDENDHNKLSLRWKMRKADEDHGLTYVVATLNRVPPSDPRSIIFFNDDSSKY